MNISIRDLSVLGYNAKNDGENSRPGPDVDVLSLGLHDEGCFGGSVFTTGKHAYSTDGGTNSVYLIHCAV